MATERVYKEAEISTLLGDSYDQEKDQDDPVQAPYRYLTKWYLAKAEKPDQRAALPDDGQFKGNVVLHAMLEGRNPSTSAVPIQIPLSKENAWVVDRTTEKRGIWIEYGPGGAWYWLKNWDESQDVLQQPIRAKLGLLSNIINILFEEHDEEDAKYASDHIKLTPKQLHKRLSCNDTEAFQDYKQRTEGDFLIFQEPFDYTLLAEHGGAKFCTRHLSGLFDGFDNSLALLFDKSTFFKGLSKGKSNKKWSVKEYRASAKLAEQRSQCQPWGEPLAHAKPIRANWNMEVSLGQTDAPKAKNKRSSKKRAGSTVHSEEPAKKKRLALEDSEDEEMEVPPQNKDEAMEEKVDLMKEERYSDEQMVAALTQLEGYLTPKPENETGKWEEVIEKMFRIKDASSAGHVLSLMRDSSDLTRECKLLVITAFLNVCMLADKGENETKIIKKRIIKKVFNPEKGGDERVNGVAIFDGWKREAKVTLERLKDLDTEDEEWFTRIVAYRILVQYIKFIPACGFLIVKQKQLEVLNQKYDVKWDQPDYLEEITKFADEYASRSQDLKRACIRATVHLKKILAASIPQPASSEATAVTGPNASTVPVAPPLTEVPRKKHDVSAAESSINNISVPACKDKDDKTEDEAAERKRKLEEERRNKIRMQQAKKKEDLLRAAAQSVAPHVAQPAPQVPAKSSLSGASSASPAADSTSASSSTPAEPLATNWVTKPSKIVARQEDWMPVTGKEPFFLNRKIPSPLPDDTTRLQENRGRSQRASRQETSLPREHRDTRREEGQVLPESHGGRDYRPPGPSRRNEEANGRGRFYDAGRRSSSFERRNSGSKDYDRDRNDRPDHRSDRSRQGHPHAPSRPRDYSRRHESENRSKDRIADSGQDRSFDDQQRHPPTYASVNEAKDAVRGSHMSQLSWEPARQQQDRRVQQAIVEDASSRGRGRGRVLPAWMTKGLTDGPSSGGGSVPLAVNDGAMPSHPPQHGAQLPQKPPSGETLQPVLSSTNRGHQPAGLPPNDDMSSRGRGRGRTLPAWMTKGHANAPSSGGIAAERLHDEGGAEGGAGRGRGRAKTLPAWMTHGKT